MTKFFLTAVSAIALMAGPALADTPAQDSANTPERNATGNTFSEDVEKAWDNAKDDVSDAARKTSDAAEETYSDIKATLINDKANTEEVTVKSRMTASNIIGQPVYNTAGDRVAKVRDIVLDKDGEVQMIVLGDGDFTGLGKMVAFDYNLLARRTADGDVIAPLTEETLARAASFTYDRNNREENVRVIPEGGISVSELLDSQLINPQGEAVADIDNISLRNGEAERLIVGFDKILGMGGKQAAMEFGDVRMVYQDEKPAFQLTDNQAQQFATFKETATSN